MKLIERHEREGGVTYSGLLPLLLFAGGITFWFAIIVYFTTALILGLLWMWGWR